MKGKVEPPNPVNEQSSADDLRKALKSYPHLGVRLSIAAHKRVPKDIAMSLARDFNPKVRIALLDNQTLLRSEYGNLVVKRLANDPIKEVYERAERLLSKG